jgi:hypothetical protein
MPARGPLETEFEHLLSLNSSKEILNKIACRGVAFHLLSYYEEDCLHTARVTIDDNKDTIIIFDEHKCCTDSIDAFRNYISKAIMVPIKECNIKCLENEPWSAKTYDHLSKEAVSLFIQGFGNLMRKAASTGYEYFLIIGWNAEAAYGRGGETRISLPSIPAVIMAHTHPSPYCYPSGPDIESTAEFLSAGGLAELIFSTNCVSVIRLSRPLQEDDYWALIEIAKEVKKAKDDYSGYVRAINRLNTLHTIVFEIM